MMHGISGWFALLLTLILVIPMLASCQPTIEGQEPATWDEQYGAAEQAAAKIDPNIALYEVQNFAGESEVIYTFIRPSGKLVYITFPSPRSTSISNIDQNASTSPPSQQRLEEQRRGVNDRRLSLGEAYQLTAQEKAWFAEQSQAPVTQRARLGGGNDSLWLVQYESGDISSPNYRTLAILINVQTGEFYKCILLKGENGEERSEKCPEVDEDTTE